MSARAEAPREALKGPEREGTSNHDNLLPHPLPRASPATDRPYPLTHALGWTPAKGGGGEKKR